MRVCLAGAFVITSVVSGCQSSGGGGNSGGSGGVTSSGGMTASGGRTSSGGATSSGGTTASGGATGSGGTTSSGGMTASGGKTGSGGATNNATGGAASGGSGSGGAASGGSASGGDAGGTHTGGISGSGGTMMPASGGVTGQGSGGKGGGTDVATCADASLLFCENFEGAALGAAASSSTWTTEVSTGSAAGTLTIDAMHSRGQKALHVHTTGNGRGLIHVKNFAPPANSFYGRMWLYVDAFPSAPNYAHFTMVEAAGTGNASKVRPVSGQFIDTGPFWGPGSDGGPTGDWTNWQKSAPATAGKWVCVQWQMDASDNGITVSIDGQANPDLSVDTKNHGSAGGDFVFPTFNDIWFGWWLYQSGPTPDHFDIWLDDLALSSAPIPCG